MANKPKKQHKRYLSYMLRLWRENADGLAKSDKPPWRASLERPQVGERLGFASLVDLFAYLEEETESNSPGSGEAEGIDCQPHKSRR